MDRPTLTRRHYRFLAQLLRDDSFYLSSSAKKDLINRLSKVLMKDNNNFSKDRFEKVANG